MPQIPSRGIRLTRIICRYVQPKNIVGSSRIWASGNHQFSFIKSSFVHKLSNIQSISDAYAGRDNNFLLVRFVAAIAVMLSHSYLITSGDPESQPLRSSTGFDLGFHAVNVFFVLSGFLIAQSWEKDPAVTRFFSKRISRIFPALIVCVLITAFALGPFLTSHPLESYFLDSNTYAYVLGSISLLSEDGPLPGVFDGLPASNVVNGSLWTLRYEFACYVGVALIGLLNFFTHQRAIRILLLISLGGIAFLGITDVGADTGSPIRHLVRFGLTFGLGMAGYLFRKMPIVRRQNIWH